MKPEERSISPPRLRWREAARDRERWEEKGVGNAARDREGARSREAARGKGVESVLRDGERAERCR